MAFTKRLLETICILFVSLLPLANAGHVEERHLSGSFSGTADQIDSYDPHDYVPAHYSKVRVAHAVLMSTVWLVIFPLGGIIPRVMSDPRLVWVHAVMQMIGFWINAAAAGMGIWMARQIDELHHYHPIVGMTLLGILAFQPATEILNHRFYQRHPRVIVAAHIHLWLGRVLLVVGAVQGGLGFLFASSFRNAKSDVAPRAAYAAVALAVWVVYIFVGIIYPEFAGSWRGKKEKKRTQAVAAEEMESLRADPPLMTPVHSVHQHATPYSPSMYAVPQMNMHPQIKQSQPHVASPTSMHYR